MKTILVVREFDSFSRILKDENFEIINLPLIKTETLTDLSDLETKIKNIQKYDGVFLTSAPAAQIFRAKIVEQRINYHGKVYVLGKRSREILEGANLDLVFDATVNTAQELLEKIPQEDLRNKKFFFVRGEKSLRFVPEFLEKMATVDEAVVYKTKNVDVASDAKQQLNEKLKSVICICFFSPSAAESFLEQFDGEILHQTKIATIGKTTANFFRERNLKVDFVPSTATAKSFAVELFEYLTNGKCEMQNEK